MDKIKIGGVDREIRVKYKMYGHILSVYATYYKKAREKFYKDNGFAFSSENKDHSLTIPHAFFFWAVWKCMTNTGFWLWKKPYRSKRKMVNDIDMDEYQNIVSFAGDVILKAKEDKKPGNSPKKETKTKASA